MAAVYSPEPVIAGGTWVSVLGGIPELHKALCTFWNSTVARRQLRNVCPKTLTYPASSETDLDGVRIPKGLAESSSKATRILSDAYNAMKDTPLKENRGMASCPVRQVLDEAAADARGLDHEEVERWRKAIAQEPTVRRTKKATVS